MSTIANTMLSAVKDDKPVDLALLDGRKFKKVHLARVGPRSRTEFKVLTGLQGRPTIIHRDDVASCKPAGRKSIKS